MLEIVSCAQNKGLSKPPIPTCLSIPWGFKDILSKCQAWMPSTPTNRSFYLRLGLHFLSPKSPSPGTQRASPSPLFSTFKAKKKTRKSAWFQAEPQEDLRERASENHPCKRPKKGTSMNPSKVHAQSYPYFSWSSLCVYSQDSFGV